MDRYMENKETVLEIKNLCVEFNSENKVLKAVNGVDLNLKKGETLGLVGETGAGKTTTALGIMGLVPEPQGKITAGEINYLGEDLLKKSENSMESIRGKEISMIFQDPMTALNPVMTVGDQIAEVIQLHEKKNHKEAFEEAKKMMYEVGLDGERAKDYPHQFSGGMKQRIVIAIAIACMPNILLADEPTTALDVTIQDQVLALVREQIKKLNSSMILITHDLGVVAENCDHVAIMYAGEIVEDGELEQIYDQTSHPYTLGLFNSLPTFNEKGGRLKPIPGHTPDPTQLPIGCAFAERCPKAQERCYKKHPNLKTVGNNHFVRCFYPVVEEE